MKKLLLVGPLLMLALVLAMPAAHAITYYSLTITVNGNKEATVKVPDINDDGVVSVPVSADACNKIIGAFGTNTFIFPGTTTGTFTYRGQTVTVNLSSQDTYTLTFLCGP